MSIVVNFGGKRIVEPGVYAQTKSGTTPQSNNFPFGDVMIIDTGSGAGFGGGAGINGELSSGLESVYAFEDPVDFRNFVKGGIIWDYSEFIFNPLIGAPSPERVYIARACTTVAAKIIFELDNGALTFISRNEGTAGNGYTDEILAQAVLSIENANVAIGVTLGIIDSDGIQVLSGYTSDTTSPADFKAKVIDAINAETATSGYTAVVKGQDVVITAPRRTGATPAAELQASGTVLTAPASLPLSGGVDGTKLSEGYSAILRTGEDDPNAWIMEFFAGTFNGVSSTGFVYGGLSKQEAKPDLVATSPEFTDIDGILNWARTDFGFNRIFKVDEDNSFITSGGAITNNDNSDYNDIQNLASGGSEEYRPEDLDTLLETILELGNTYFLCDKFGDEAYGVENLKILDHILNDAEFDKFMVVGGGIDQTKFKDTPNSSIEVAKKFDSERVILVHSGVKRFNPLNGTDEKLPSIYHAANVVGRIGGIEPQDPVTFKALRVQNFLHTLGKKERERALQAGVLHNRFVPGIGQVVNQGINTLQKNTQQINPDGTSFEISIMNIGAQLNKELVLNMRPLFVGKNRGKITKADVKSFVEGYLLKNTSDEQTDGLIIKFLNVTVRLEAGYYDVRYAYVPNGPINKLFVTGFMLDTNL